MADKKSDATSCGSYPAPGCWVVQLERGVWIADGEGDPPSTLVEANARRFDKYLTAKMQLNAIRRRTHRQFVNAWIHPPNPRVDGTAAQSAEKEQGT